jgi:DNA invertase Pin-like site-specific DNA recombinase
VNMSETILPSHRQRQAIIYVRQSSPNQAVNHQESLKLQYALRERALQAGWPELQICIIDNDIGVSGRSADLRQGFQQLVADVTLGRVGIIFAYDVTRLSRNCTDWYRLLDLCAVRECLVGDQDGIYDPASANGRLILGLKGLISELELHTIKARLTAGLLNKARRGELALHLPVGLVRDELKRVVKHPNLEVQSRITLVFSTFLRVRSAAKTQRELRQANLFVPSQEPDGELVWRSPTVPGILGILKNPAYAGAFAYGRTRTIKLENGRTRQVPIASPSEWKICVKDKWLGYINWQSYETILAMLKDNQNEYDRNKNRGVPRAGSALLHGLMYCGVCGHKMVVQYKGRTTYLCNHQRQCDGSPVCQYLPADAIDAWVVKTFLSALEPMELDIYEQAVTQLRHSQAEIDGAKSQQLERLRYEVRLAEKQYRKADPENRLVTAELEKRWESALRSLQQAEEEMRVHRETFAANEWRLSPELKQGFLEATRNFADLWKSELLTREHRKSLLRCLIEKVVAHRESPDMVQIRVVWQGGDTTSTTLKVRVGSLQRRTDHEQMVAEILKLSNEGRSDRDIALSLTQAGHRSPRSDDEVLESTVRGIRLRARQFRKPNRSHPRRIAGYLTVPQLAEKLKVSRQWIYDRIDNGTIESAKSKKHGLYLFRDNAKTLRDFRDLIAGKLDKLRH